MELDDTSAQVDEEGDNEFIDLDELTTLALAADPNPRIDPRAKPFRLGDAVGGGTLLPEWYMPPALSRIHPGWRKWAIAAIVALLVGIEISGLCSAFGQLVVG